VFTILTTHFIEFPSIPAGFHPIDAYRLILGAAIYWRISRLPQCCRCYRRIVLYTFI